MKLIDHPYIDNLIIPSDIMGDKKYYLYVHYRQDKHEAFYVGIGTKFRKKDYDRALCYTKRNPIWKRICNKTRYNVMIISETDSKQEIINREINYIKILGKKKDKTGILSNITDGGEGLKGYKVTWTPEMRAAASERLKHRIVKESTREKLRELIKERSFYGKSALYTSKPILRVDKETKEVVEEFLNAVEAGKKYNVTAASIHSAVNNGFTSVGYKWKYKDIELQTKVENKLKNKIKKVYKKPYNPKSKKVIMFKDLEEVSFTSLREAGKFIGKHHCFIKDACEKQIMLNNYYWKYGN